MGVGEGERERSHVYLKSDANVEPDSFLTFVLNT